MLLSLLVSIALAFTVTHAEVVPPPGDADCWSSTFGLIQNEVGGALNPTISLDEERKYVFCPGVYKLVLPNPAAGQVPDASLGEQWPLLLFTPNIHLSCPTGDCVFEMQTVGSAIFAASTPFVAQSGLVPEGLTAPNSDISNLIVDGFVFRNVNGTIFDDTNGVVTLQPPGTDIVIKNCLFDTVGLAGWAIASEYYASEVALSNNTQDSLYQSVTIQDCTFMDSAFDRSAIIAFAVDATPDGVTNQVTLKNLIFDNCTNTGTTFGGGWKGLITTDVMATASLEVACFSNVKTPTGALAELRGPESTATGIYGDGMTMAIAESGLSEECVGGVLVEGVCSQSIIDSCPLVGDMETVMPTVSPTDEPEPSTTSEAAILQLYRFSFGWKSFALALAFMVG